MNAHESAIEKTCTDWSTVMSANGLLFTKHGSGYDYGYSIDFLNFNAGC